MCLWTGGGLQRNSRPTYFRVEQPILSGGDFPTSQALARTHGDVRAVVEMTCNNDRLRRLCRSLRCQRNLQSVQSGVILLEEVMTSAATSSLPRFVYER
jgi:hypothetical protein